MQISEKQGSKGQTRISDSRREYNKFVNNELMEDFALRFTPHRARKWSYSRIANTALGFVSFLVLEAIGGAITLNYGFANSAWAILALTIVVMILGVPIGYYAARYGLDMDLLTRGAGFGYIGSTITSLIYASFTFIFFALEASIMSMALELLFGIPIEICYALSALVVIPLTTHGITYISQFQLVTQPIWLALQLLPLIYVFTHPDSKIQEWIAFPGKGNEDAQSFNLLLFGSASAVLLSLVAQIGEQVDFLRFLPAGPDKKKAPPFKWWCAMILAGPGWIFFGAAKLFLGSFLAYIAIKQGVEWAYASDPAHAYQATYAYLFRNETMGVLVAAIFIIISQLKINVANAYAGSLAWSNFFSRITHNHPGRVVWMIFNIMIALLLMEMGIYKTIESMLQVYSVLVLSWLGSVCADLLINKSIGLSPRQIEFKRSRLHDINPVGLGSMITASFFGFVAYSGLFGETIKALGSYIALLIPFIAVPTIARLTKGQFYLVNNMAATAISSENEQCVICENTFEQEDMTFCPAYNNPICSLCCSLEIRCGDQCRDGATLSEQFRLFLTTFFKDRPKTIVSAPVLQTLVVTSILALVCGATLILIYLQLDVDELTLSEIVAPILIKVFFFFLIIISVISWLLSLARDRNQSVLEELKEQTIALANEVEEHEKTNLAYKAAKESAESASLAKSKYLAGLSHELRTPLNILLGYTQLLSQDREVPARAKESLLTMKRNGDHLAGLIEDVLEFSKIEAGRLSLQRDEIHIRQLIDQLISMFHQQSIAKGLSFNTSIARNLPVYVYGDKQRLRQILINLLSNAVKFTDKGKVTFEVSYRSEVCCFSIKDTGPGIPQQHYDTIFLPFERIDDESTSDISGTGLGLTISRAMAVLMGGDITLSSEVGKGSQFDLKLMLPALQDISEGVSTENTTVVGYEGPAKTILVIDDDEFQRKLCYDILNPLKFTVLLADSGFSGLSLLSQNQIDLVLLDLKMPNTNGWQVAEEIRRRGYKIPIIIASANVRDLEVKTTSRMHHNDYLVKPFSIEEVLDKLEKWMGITWTRIPSEPDDSSLIASKPILTEAQLQSLKYIATIGYRVGFLQKIDEIKEINRLPNNELDELYNLAKESQFKKIINRLETLIIETSL